MHMHMCTCCTCTCACVRHVCVCTHIAGGARPAPHARPAAAAATAAAAAAAFGGTIAKPLHDSALSGGGIGGSPRGECRPGGCGGPCYPREGAAGVGVRHGGGRDHGGSHLVGLSSRGHLGYRHACCLLCLLIYGFYTHVVETHWASNERRHDS